MHQSFTNRQIAFILFGTIVGYGIIGLPKDIAERAGTGGWIALLIATAIAIMSTSIIAYLGYVHENKTLYEYSQILTGKYITFLLMSFYMIYFFLFFTMIIRMTSEVIKLTILIQTPVWVLCLLFFAIVYYAVIKGLTFIARICELYGFIIILGALFIHFLIFTQGELINLRPFWGSGNLQTYLKASAATVIPFLGMEVLTFVPMDKKNNKNVFKYTTSMIAFIGFLYMIEFESCLSIIGVDDIIYYKDALMATIRRTDIPYLEFLRRLDGIFLSVWIMSIFCTSTLFGYGSVWILSKFFHKIRFRLLGLIVMVLSFIVSQIPETTNQVEKVIDFTGFLALFAAIFIPSILFIMTKVRKYDKKSK